MQSVPTERYSSDVRIFLEIDGQRLNVAQVGPSRMILRDRINTTSTNANLVITVDGRTKVQPIVVPAGLSVESEEVRYF